MVYFDDATLIIKPSELTECKVIKLKGEIDDFFMDAQKVIFDVSQIGKLDMGGVSMLLSIKVGCERSHKEFDLVGVDNGMQKFLMMLHASDAWE
jgi:ABC-type transporter Mla MlaB component